MKQVSIVATRSVKISQLTAEHKKNVPANWKGDDYPYSNATAPYLTSISSDFQEALAERGEAWMYEAYEDKMGVLLNQKVAAAIVLKVSDPSKITGKAGKAIPVKIDLK